MYDCVSGQAVNVGVTMYVLSISSLSEVEMVLGSIFFFFFIFTTLCCIFKKQSKRIVELEPWGICVGLLLTVGNRTFATYLCLYVSRSLSTISIFLSLSFPCPNCTDHLPWPLPWTPITEKRTDLEAIFSLPQVSNVIFTGVAVTVGVSMYVLSISRLSEVDMVMLPPPFLTFLPKGL